MKKPVKITDKKATSKTIEKTKSAKPKVAPSTGSGRAPKTGKALRKQAVEPLMQADDHYRQLVENMPSLICTFLPDSTLTYVNAAYCELFSKRPDELVGIKFLDLLPDEATRQNVRSKYMSLTPENPVITYEHEAIVADGTSTFRWYRWTDRAFFKADGKISHFQSIGQDITASKQTEKSLWVSDNKFRLITENMTDCIALVDGNGIYQYTSPSYRAILGYNQGELIGMSGFSLTHPDDLERITQIYLRALEKGLYENIYETRLRHRDGHYVPMEVKASSLKDSQGKIIGGVVAGSDITVRKQAEAELRETEDRYKALFERSLDLVYICDLQGFFTDANDVALTRLGYTREEMPGLNFASLISEDQLPLAFKTLKDIEETGFQKVTTEYKLRHKDGSSLYITTLGAAIYSNGKLTGIQSIARDITEHRQIEERLRESERFALATLNALSAQVAILDDAGSIISVNQAWNAFSAANAPPGADLKIYEGVNYLSVCETSSGLYSEEGKVMVAGIGLVMSGKQKEFTLEYPCHSPEEKRWFNARVTSFTTEGALRILVAHENITTRKHAEEELRASEMRFRGLADAAWEGIIIHSEGVILDANATILKMFGWSAEEAIGKSVLEYLAPESIEPALQKLKESIDRPQLYFEGSGLKKDKTVFPIELSGRPIKYNNLDARVVAIRDLTHRKQAEEALRESELQHRTIFENSPLGMTHINSTGVVVNCNESFAKLIGAPREKVIGFNVIEQANDREEREAVQKGINGQRVEFEKKYTSSTGGKTTEWHVIVNPVNPGQSPTDVITTHEDITDRMRMETELREAHTNLESKVQERTLELARLNEELTMEIIERIKSEERYRLLADNSTDVIFTMTLAGKVTYVSPSIIKMSGFTPEEVMGMSLQEQMVESSAARVITLLAEQLQKPSAERSPANQIEVQLNCKDGTIKDAEIIAGWLLNDRGEPIGVQGSSRDITSRKRAENDLKDSEEWNKNILRTVLSGVLVIDAATRKIVEANNTALKLIGLPKEQVIGCVCHKFICPAEEKSCPILDLGNNVDSAEKILLTADGKQKSILKTVTSIEFRNHRYLIESFIDLTERKRAEAYLKDIIAKNPMSVQVLDKEGFTLEVNPSFEALFGSAPPSGYSIFNDIQLAQQGMGALFDQLRNGEIVYFPDTYFNVRDSIPGMPDVPVWIRTIGFTVKDSLGEPERFILMHENITERKRADDEKLKLESQLLQSQKMEAIGQLAGGIAHDFKNILGSISGFTELTLKQVPADSKANKYLKRIFNVSKRAVELVNQILMFSRKDTSQLKPLRLAPLLTDVINLVKAITPKTVDIRQNLKAESDLVKADSTSIHQVVMNLCSNANFAMQKKGGVLTIDLINESILPGDLNHPDVNPGPYLKLTVSDTGEGIDQAVIDKIFEPFFTTKKQGEGTGMGLSVVYGIVKSLGGEIKVKSRLGKGTSFEILLPEVSDIITENMQREDIVSIRGSGRILFVDDEEDLVDIATDMLSGLGYGVTATQGAIEALEIFRANPRYFDLVITDQMMPEMTGMELAQEILRIRPEMPIILCTAFSGNMEAQDVINAGIRELVGKPMIQNKIANSIHQILKNKPLTDVISLAVTPDDVSKADLPPAFGLPKEQFAGVRALVADDQEFNRELIYELLQEKGIEVDIAINGREALEMVRARDYDIVLMDIEMPEMDGLTATSEIRKLGTEGVARLPIIALSGHSITDDKGKSQAAGMNDYLTKPIDTVALAAALKKWLPRGKNVVAVDDAPDIMTTMQSNGLDASAALKRLGGNRKLYLKLMGVFMEGYGEAPAQLQQEMQAGKLEEALRRVHSIKGVAGTIGSTALQDAATQLEKSLWKVQTCDHPTLAEPLQIFSDCHAALVKTIGLFLPRLSGERPARQEGQPWDAAQMRLLLTRLKTALESEEPLLCNKILGELLQRPCPANWAAVLAELNRLISGYNLAEALALLEKELIK